MSFPLPLGLKAAIEAGNCTLFLGSGIGYNVRRKDGSPAPTGAMLASELAQRFGIETDGQNELAKVAELVVAKRGRPELESFLSECLADLEPDEPLQWLLRRTWKAVFTTNFDRVIQRCYELNDSPTQKPVTFSSSTDFVPLDTRFEVPIYHLHGSLFEGDSKFALITQSDYATFREHRRMLFEVLKVSFATSPILYVGYANEDPNWNMVLGELQSEFAPRRPPESYRVAPSTSQLDQDVLKARGITSIDASLTDFVATLDATFGDIRVEPYNLSSLSKDIPSDLRSLFDKAPPSVARLLASWSYVNQEDFSLKPNTNEFLRGDRANWSAIEKGFAFQRDIEDVVFEDLVDFATDTSSKTKALAVLAPAGYGTTTALMQLAVRLANEGAGKVLFHRHDAPFIPGDVAFVAKNMSDAVFFFVDNASDLGEALPSVVAQCREAGYRVCFVLGDRLNEWRQRHLRMRPTEFLIDPLSDPEIGRLLACLESAGALGVLTELPPSMQRAAIKNRHHQELLVTMQEATEGRAFAAIIEDEYLGLASDKAREIYATVCAFYRVRSMVRDSVVADVANVDVAEMYKLTKDALEGVIRLSTLSESQGVTGMRTRHHVIADMVWTRCLGSSEREKILIAALDALNLNFGPDARAFDNFVRDDEGVESIGSVEGRIDFFEDACRKSPVSPYVRQHYARMLRRAKKFEIALDQIDTGLALDANAKVLHHTRGLILADMAFASPSAEIRRRRLMQSEEEFERLIATSPRDDYGYQSLATLYLDWARDAPTPAESAEYLRRAEEKVALGLSKVHQRERLWIVSSKISDFLEDAPATVEALKRAIHENSRAMVARYLYATHLLSDRKFDEAIEVLQPILEETPDDYRAALVYGTALHRKGESYEKCLAILQLGQRTGQRDTRYLATYAGMLFMAGRISEANIEFRTGREIPVQSSGRTQFVPVQNDHPIELSGVVQRLRPGFTFIRTPGYPDFFHYGLSTSDVLLSEGMEVKFRIAFSARGPVATDIRLTT